MTLATDLKATLQLAPHQRERIASKLSVSASTVDRWASGNAIPSPRHQSALEAMIQEMSPDSVNKVARELHRSLADAREVMHRYGLTSSRNEAIDQLAVLLLLHLFLLEEEGAGIGGSVSVANAYLSKFRKYLARTFSPPVQASLSRSVDFLETHPEYLEALISCLSAPLADIKYNEIKKNGHFLHEVFVAFLSSSFHEEKEFAQYMTPPEIVDFMIGIAVQFCGGSIDRAKVLDPSCGTGSFLTAFAEHRDLLADSSESYASICRDLICGIDTNERMARIASVSLVASGLNPGSIVMDNSLAPISASALALLNGDGFDVILTNPPFGAEHSKGKHGGRGIPSEILYLQKYVDWLKDDGVAVVILPDSVLTNKGLYAQARSDLLSKCDIIAVISLPTVTFAASGTTTKTSILAFRKRGAARYTGTTFAVAENVGFGVSNRGSIRKRVPSEKNDLPKILEALYSVQQGSDVSKNIGLEPHHERWDAQFWMSPLAQEKRSSLGGEFTSTKMIATIVRDKADPRKFAADTFQYIEISCVSGDLLRVAANELPTSEAPSRARRRVRAGDVLISTVRPERRTVGVVPPRLDGAICSTGFGVLRPKDISPYALAAALRSDHATAQLIGVSSGVAYPVFDPEVLLGLELNIRDEAWRAKCAEYGEILEQMEMYRDELLLA